MVREASPEGIWKANLPAGGTTDDTRWKNLTVDYLLSQKSESLDSKAFASHLLNTYRGSLDKLKNTGGQDVEPFENALQEANWLSEWAKVASPYLEDNLGGYADSLSKFYGGEMVCAGLLYAPTLGAFFPGNPKKAYREAYKLSIFDQGSITCPKKLASTPKDNASFSSSNLRGPSPIMVIGRLVIAAILIARSGRFCGFTSLPMKINPVIG